MEYKSLDNINQPAFPVDENTTDRIDYGTKIYYGLTKREQIAAMALQGLISNTNYDLKNKCDQYAKDATLLADALLEHLENTKP